MILIDIEIHALDYSKTHFIFLIKMINNGSLFCVSTGDMILVIFFVKTIILSLKLSGVNSEVI